jgi:hypothetical protein
MPYTGAVVIIPTRDRTDLLRNAVESVLGQSGLVHLLVSDNSISVENRWEVSQYVRELRDERVRYISPPKPLPMSQHWDWAINQALSLYGASHFSFLTDRMVFKPEALKSIIAILTAYPDKLLVYMHDKVLDFAPPYKVLQHDWNGKLYEVAAARLLKLTAESVMYDSCIPRMLNGFVPRTILETIQSRFGNIFSSLSPDWNFAYRCLDTLDSILFIHKALLVHYATNRSTGESAHRGIRNAAFEQFVKEVVTTLSNAPYPEIITVWNGVIHEYVQVQKEAQSTKFPKLNMARYRQALAVGIGSVENSETRKKMKDMLRKRGWRPSFGAWRQLSLAVEMMSVRQMWNFFKSSTNLSRLRTFENSEQALEFATTHLRPISKGVHWEEALHRGVEVPRPVSSDREWFATC